MIERSSIAALCAALLILAVFASVSTAAEFSLQPSVTLGEEYNDNVFLTTTDRTGDFITRIAPAVETVYKAPLWDWDAAYMYDYRHYATASIDDQKISTGHIAALTRIVPEHLFFEARDEYSRVSIDTVRNFTEESSFVNVTDRNIVILHPYAVARPSTQTTLTAGYLYRDTRYKSQLGVDTIEHTGYADFKRDISKRLTLNAGARYIRNDNDVNPYRQRAASLGPSYEYKDGSTVSATAGYTRFDFDRDGAAEYAYWDARITHTYSTMTAVYETGVAYIADPTRVLRREDRYIVTVRTERGMLTFEVSGGVREYREVGTNGLETTSYRAGGVAGYAPSEKTKFTGTLTLERLRDYVAQTTDDRYLTSVRMERTAPKDLTWALEYRYTNVYSPDIYTDNYTNNRISAEVIKKF